MSQIVWQTLNSPLVVLALGFVLTTLVGAFLASQLQQKNWKHQTQLTLFQKRYDEGVRFLDELSDLIGKRYFLLQRYLWAIKSPGDYDVDRVKNEYFQCVQEWNSKLRTMRNKARLLIGEKRALQLLDYGDDHRPADPRSLHYIFAKVHNRVIAAKKNIDDARLAEKEVEQLNFACSEFLEDFTTEFLKRAKNIQLVELPGEMPNDS